MENVTVPHCGIDETVNGSTGAGGGGKYLSCTSTVPNTPIKSVINDPQELIALIENHYDADLLFHQHKNNISLLINNLIKNKYTSKASAGALATATDTLINKLSDDLVQSAPAKENHNNTTSNYIHIKGAKTNVGNSWTSSKKKIDQFISFAHNFRRFDYRSNKFYHITLKTTNLDNPQDSFKLIPYKNRSSVTYRTLLSNEFTTLIKNVNRYGSRKKNKYLKILYYQWMLEFDPTGHPHIHLFIQFTDESESYLNKELLSIFNQYWSLSDIQSNAIQHVKNDDHFQNCLNYCVEVPSLPGSLNKTQQKLDQSKLPKCFHDMKVQIDRVGYSQNKTKNPIVLYNDRFLTLDFLEITKNLEDKISETLEKKKNKKKPVATVPGSDAGSDVSNTTSSNYDNTCPINDIIFNDDTVPIDKPANKPSDRSIVISVTMPKPCMSYNERLQHDETTIHINNSGWYRFTIPFKKYFSKLPSGGFGKDKMFHIMFTKKEFFQLILIEVFTRILRERESLSHNANDIIDTNSMPMHGQQIKAA